MDITIVTPVHNEDENIARFVARIRECLDGLPVTWGILFVDDGSVDGTWGEITRINQEDGQVNGLRFSRNFGKESAIAAGLSHAGSRCVVTMDVDLQHPPALLPEMIRLWRDEGSRIVEAIKVERQAESRYHTFLAETFYRAFSFLSGLSIKGATDFKLLDRQVVQAWKQLRERNLFFRGNTLWLGFSRAQVPFHPPERTLNRSSWRFRQLLELAVTALTSYSSKPLLLIWFFTFLFFASGSVLAVYTVWDRLFGSQMAGFSTGYILQLIIGGFELLSLSLISIYLKAIYDEVKSRPLYIVVEQTDSRFPDT